VQLALVVASGIQPIQNLAVLRYVGLDKKMEWAKHWITEGFTGLETMLKKTAGKYCFGDEVTIADLCLIPQVYNANRFGVDMSAFPTITRINEACSQLPAFQNTHPDKMPDSE